MTTVDPRAVLDRIDDDAITKLTCELIAAPSENPGGTEAATVAVLAAAAADAGLSVRLQEAAPGRENVIATLPGGDGPGLMFLGHSDVVPAGPGWTDDPYTPRVHDGLIVGRGSTDMKGGLAAILTAMRALAGQSLSGPVILVCAVDEEEHGAGVRHLVRHPPVERYLGCVVAEPTHLKTVIACRGASYIEIGVTGRAAHSGRPADGRSAIDAAARIVEVIRADHDAMQRSLDPLLGAGTWNVGTISGGQGISVVAPTCELGVDRRLMPGESVDAIAEVLRQRISAAGIDSDGIVVDVRATMEMPGFSTPESHPLVTEAVAALGEVGVATKIGGWTAACDGGFVSRDLGVPAIVLGPGDINSQAHQPDESVAIADLSAASRAYALLACRLLG